MSTLGPTTEEIWNALVELVKLQSHYATLLNHYDGGERMTFVDPHAWIQRLREVKGCRHVRVRRGANSPRVYGSWRTQQCLDCGAFRTHRHNVIPDPLVPLKDHPWRPASEYADEVAENGGDE